MNIRTKIFFVVGFGVLLIIGGYYLSRPSELANNAQTIIQTEPTLVQENTQLSYQCESGKNVFEILEKTAKKIEFENQTLGKLVTSINGVKQGQGKYWLYSIDDKEATVGAEAYICQDNEIIKWELK